MKKKQQLTTAYGRRFDFDDFMRAIKKAFESYNDIPIVTFIAVQENDPFKVLISTILSARTKDQTTGEACKRLFKAAPDAASLAALSEKKIEKLIYPVGFYHTKAKNIRAAARALLEQHNAQVPATLEQLLTLPGVGRKTANLVLGEAFQTEAICVDTHVHRISNRLGLITTSTPAETEKALTTILPKTHWIRYNTYLVAHGQKVCKPISPLCTQCRVTSFCKQVGVGKHR
jgi:endonuclease-3